MSVEGLNRWLAPIANVALLLGLVLVAYELNQNRVLTRVQIINEGNLAQNQTYSSLMGEVPAEVVAKAVECPDEMTYADFLAIDAFLTTSMGMLYRNFELAQEGIFTEDEWRGGVDTYVSWFLGNPFGRAWWGESGRDFYPAEFATYIDRRLANTEGMDSYGYWMKVRSRMPEPERSAMASRACESAGRKP